MKNNRLLCPCLTSAQISAGARSPRYRQKNNPLRPVVSVRCDCLPQGAGVRQDLGFFLFYHLCLTPKKLATHCSRARKLAHFLKRLLIFSWPPMPLTHSVSTFIRPLRIRIWRSGVTDWKNAYRILGLFMTSAAAICSYCSAPQTSRITFNHCQP